MPLPLKKSEPAKWYAFFDPKNNVWRPFFGTGDFVKWGDVLINEELGEKFYKLRIVSCEGKTAKEIEAAIITQYATLEKDNATQT